MTASTLRKAICFGEAGVIKPVSTNSQYLAYEFGAGSGNYANLDLIQDTGTRWIRLWAHLPTFWPTENYINPYYRDQLDYQIALAKVYGCGVILTIHHDLPEWINDSTNTRAAPPASRLSTTGAWTNMFRTFARRYSLANTSRPYNGYSYVDILEFTNEPNGLMQVGIGGDLVGTVATMFKRAKEVAASIPPVAGYGRSPLIGGPAASDIGPGKGSSRDYDTFTTSLLARLSNTGFYVVGADEACLWTHHNYSDVTYDHGLSTIAPDRASYGGGNPNYNRYILRSNVVRNLLLGYSWRGWPDANPINPRIFITEGGAKRSSVEDFWGVPKRGQPGFTEEGYENYQNFLVYRNLRDRMATDTEGAGIELLTNYLMITADLAENNQFDTGLYRAADASAPLLPRSVSYNTWKPFPGRL